MPNTIKYFCLSLNTPERRKIYEQNKKIIPKLTLLQSVNGYNKTLVLELLKKVKLSYINIEFQTYGTLANFLTKYLCLLNQIQKGFNYICFIEDDFLLLKGFTEFVEKQIPLLETETANMIRLGKWGEGYITSLQGAKNIVSSIQKKGIMGNIDNQLREACGKEVDVNTENKYWKMAFKTNKGDCLKTEKFTNKEIYQYLGYNKTTLFTIVQHWFPTYSKKAIEKIVKTFINN